MRNEETSNSLSPREFLSRKVIAGPLQQEEVPLWWEGRGLGLMCPPLYSEPRICKAGD